MIYDHQVNMSEVYAPVQANIMVRSQSEQRPKKSSQKATVRNASGVSNGHRINIEKFTSYLQGITRNTSTQKCARSIRVGLQSSGAKIVNHPVAAADWGSTLMQLGYKKINASFDRPKKAISILLTVLRDINMDISRLIQVVPGYQILSPTAHREAETAKAHRG